MLLYRLYLDLEDLEDIQKYFLLLYTVFQMEVNFLTYLFCFFFIYVCKRFNINLDYFKACLKEFCHLTNEVI